MINNMRDLGGIVTASGQTIKHGCLIRSARLENADEQELNGISKVIDLRTPWERYEAPDRVYGREYLTLPIVNELTLGISHEQETEDQDVSDMKLIYRELVNKCRSGFSNVMKAIMQHDYSSGAVLWHCTEGKDRCGMTAALVLEALGVDRAIIMEDYLKTNIVNLPKATAIRDRLLISEGREIADRAYRAYIADAEYLETAWNEMGTDYLTELGIRNEEIEMFRQRVLK